MRCLRTKGQAQATALQIQFQNCVVGRSPPLPKGRGTARSVVEGFVIRAARVRESAGNDKSLPYNSIRIIKNPDT